MTLYLLSTQERNFGIRFSELQQMVFISCVILESDVNISSSSSLPSITSIKPEHQLLSQMPSSLGLLGPPVVSPSWADPRARRSFAGCRAGSAGGDAHWPLVWCCKGTFPTVPFSSYGTGCLALSLSRITWAALFTLTCGSCQVGCVLGKHAVFFFCGGT